MKSLEAPNPLWLTIRCGEKPKSDVELMQVMTSMIRTAEHFDRGKSAGVAPLVVKCKVNGILVEATSKTDVSVMFKEYWKEHAKSYSAR
jgi:hypothetical protein